MITDVLLTGTKENVYVCSLTNEKGKGAEQHVSTRDPAVIRSFISKWDKAGRGLFFCVSTIGKGKRRAKENTSETLFLHVDIDFKDLAIDRNEVERRLRSLALPPSIMHASGNGLHAFWLLDKICTDGDRIEKLLKKLAGILAGDRMVTHRAALMRVPHSHNTKNGGWVEVKVIKNSSRKYSIVDLEKWLDKTAPVILPKTADANPFLRAGQEFDYKQPIDVKKRLHDMQFKGEGDAAVHTTQLSVSASLLNQGMDVDNVVATLLDATQKAVGAEGRSWNWTQEERDLRAMCQKWLDKHGNEIVEEKVVNLGERRAQKQIEDLQLPKKTKPHIVIGTGILNVLQEKGEQLKVVNERLWHYADGLWKERSPSEAKAWLEVMAETGCRALKLQSNTKLVSEVRTWIMRNPDLQGSDIEWDNHGKIATLSGLIDPKTGTIEEFTPEHYATHRIDCEFNPKAECRWWKRMLSDCFSDKATIAVLQEIAGAALIENKPRALRRALVLVGPSNSGKSNLLNVLAGLLTDNPNTTPFDMLENAHGLTEFLRSAPWLLHEAFDQSKWHFSATTKALLSGDHISVNIKNGPLLAHRFKSAVLWGTNSPPQFKEASKAMEHRLAIISCHNVFDAKKMVGSAAEAIKHGFSTPADFVLAKEKSGILNWALAGLRQVLVRGHFNPTKEMEEAMHEVSLQSNLAAGFLEECCEFDRKAMIATPDFCAAFSIWFLAEKGEDRKVPSNDSIGRFVTTLADKRIIKRVSNSMRYYVGIKLNKVGLDYWNGAHGNSLSAGKTSRLSNKVESVNQVFDGQYA